MSNGRLFRMVDIEPFIKEQKEARIEYLLKDINADLIISKYNKSFIDDVQFRCHYKLWHLFKEKCVYSEKRTGKYYRQIFDSLQIGDIINLSDGSIRRRN